MTRRASGGSGTGESGTGRRGPSVSCRDLPWPDVSDRKGSGRAVVAIVGRPNVGKSTLFNRLVGSRKAIVEDTPGVTRDVILGEVEWEDRRFFLIDTGGLETGMAPGSIASKVRAQIEKAVSCADLLLLVVDGRAGDHPQDMEIVRILRKAHKPILCAVNKIDSGSASEGLYPFYRFGLEPLIPVSAEHGLGIQELLDAVVERLPKRIQPEEDAGAGEAIPMAVVGRPNVGKSTLVNALLGEERQLVDKEPGTTRDAVDTAFSWEGSSYVLIDTAGIRRKARVIEGLEKLSVSKALQSVDRCEVALLVLDAWEGVTDQDAQIGRYILDRAKGLVLLLNKWDLLKGSGRRPGQVVQAVREGLPHLGFAPIVPISALTGYNIDNAMRWVRRVEKAYRQRIPTGPLNRLLGEVVRSHPPRSEGPQITRLHYITQVREAPPTFLVFTNTSRRIQPSYQRYLVHQIRGRFGFKGVPIRLVFRRKG